MKLHILKKELHCFKSFYRLYINVTTEFLETLLQLDDLALALLEKTLYSMHHRTLIQSFEEPCIWMKRLITEYVLMGLEWVEWIKLDLVRVGLIIFCS